VQGGSSLYKNEEQGVLKYVIKRLFFIVIALFIASILIFLIVEAVPGDVAQMILGQNVTEEALQALRQKLGLDQPLPARYIDWIGGIVQGDMGESLSIPGVEVSELIIRRGRNSLFLAAAATLFLVPISILLGVFAGLNEDSWIDNLVSTVSLIALSVPEFISGTFMILIFSIWLGVLPATSAIDPTGALLPQFSLLILPILTVSLVLLGYVARMVRASVIDASRSYYARTAVLKGISRFHVITRHILKNALLPAVTIIAMNLGWLIGGIIIVETVFGFPGLGRLVLFAIKQRDVPLIEASVLVMGAAYLVLNLLADIIYTWLNPRIRYS
jgi:peptide/nickel transport system permease protein